MNMQRGHVGPIKSIHLSDRKYQTLRENISETIRLFYRKIEKIVSYASSTSVHHENEM